MAKEEAIKSIDLDEVESVLTEEERDPRLEKLRRVHNAVVEVLSEDLQALTYGFRLRKATGPGKAFTVLRGTKLCMRSSKRGLVFFSGTLLHVLRRNSKTKFMFEENAS